MRRRLLRPLSIIRRCSRRLKFVKTFRGGRKLRRLTLIKPIGLSVFPVVRPLLLVKLRWFLISLRNRVKPVSPGRSTPCDCSPKRLSSTVVLIVRNCFTFRPGVGLKLTRRFIVLSIVQLLRFTFFRFRGRQWVSLVLATNPLTLILVVKINHLSCCPPT